MTCSRLQGGASQTGGVAWRRVGAAVAVVGIAAVPVVVGWRIVDSTRDDAYRAEETRLAERIGDANRLFEEWIFGLDRHRPARNIHDGPPCALNGLAVPAISFVVLDHDGSVACDESGGLVTDPEAFGAWVADTAPEDRSFAIGPPGAQHQLVEVDPVNDRWIVGVESPPTTKAWAYLDIDYGYLVSPDDQVVREQSPLDAPQVATVPEGEFERIDVPFAGEVLATSKAASLTTGWRIVAATDVDTIERHARDRWGPAVVVLVPMTILGWAALGLAWWAGNHRRPSPSAPAPA